MKGLMMTETATKVLEIAVEYLGPAALRFLDRQASGHMDGQQFEMIEVFHLDELAKWIGISAKLVIDKEKAAEFAKRVLELKG